MPLVPLNWWCVGCGHRFHAGTVTPPLDETQYDSFLYGAHPDQQLCKECSAFEEEQVDQKGTNYLPQLLQSYADSSGDCPKKTPSN